MAIIAKAFNKPVYVAAESYKFARLFPLNQQDLPKGRVPSIQIDPPVGISKGNYISSCNPCVDYTPAEYIQLLITDLGILTPSAVSDELIKLYS
jgi:translation initiation factor eIF-2B subunit alpha